MKKEAEIPNLYEEYDFWDRGKEGDPSSHYIAWIMDIITPDHARDIVFSVPVHNFDDNSRTSITYRKP